MDSSVVLPRIYGSSVGGICRRQRTLLAGNACELILIPNGNRCNAQWIITLTKDRLLSISAQATRKENSPDRGISSLSLTNTVSLVRRTSTSWLRSH